MASIVEVCNLALDALGQTTGISSISEQSKAARACSRHFQQTLDELMSAHPWPFARVAAALALTTDTVYPGWEYQYAYPASAARIWRVCDEDGVRFRLGELWHGCEYPHAFHAIPMVPYQVVHGDDQSCIVTDLEDAYALYTQRLTNTDRLPPLFIKALQLKLAQALCMPLAIDPDRRRDIDERATAAVAEAQAEGFNESTPDPDPLPDSIRARG